MSLNTPEPEELEYKLLTRDKVQEALAVQAETMKQECLALGLGMFEENGAPEEMLLLFKEIMKDGATIIAVDKETDQLAAVAFNKIHASHFLGFPIQFQAQLDSPLSPTLPVKTFLCVIEGSAEGRRSGPAGGLHRGEPEAALVQGAGEVSW